MQSKKQFTMILCLVLTFMAISCSNTYNNLVPNDKQNILEFSLSSEDHKTRSVSSEIRENYITVKVPKGTDITRLFPKAVLPKQATLFPLTLKYLQEAFPRTDVLDMALRINPAKKGLENWFLTLYEENPDFSIPPLVFPINFFYPVTFAVIGGQGGVEIYTVKVIYDDGSEPDVGDLPDPNLDESKKILSFYVPDKQKGTSTITHNTIDFMLKAGTDLRAILPEITTEPEAVAIPLTREYLFEASSKLGLDPLTFAQGYIDSSDKRAFIKGAIASSDTSNLSLAIDKIIDFTNPIQIVVLGTISKSVRIYTVTASLDKDEAYLKRIVFTKVKNPSLIRDYIGEVFQEEKEVSCTLYYPYEYGASGDEKAFNLILDSQYTGSNLTIEYNGKEYSLNDEVPFKPIKMGNELYYLGNARAKLHVDNGGMRKTYSLKLTFKEDPDTIRSITDFRFETFYNSKIKATSIASIVNRDDEGEIKAEVLYSGEKPNRLIPSFITGGGKVLVYGNEQISKSSEQYFSAHINYVCVSKNGQYARTYTVIVKFIKVESPEVVLKSFKFPFHLNKEISQDAIGIIDEAHGTVSVDVVYDGTEKPLDLVSEFSATGAVSIEGITQSSGFSTQNYKYDVYLKVTALDDENVSKTYRVHVTFNYSTQNKCQLLRFYFEKEKNPTLKETVEGYISSSSYNVYAVVPKECDETQLVPSFEAEGVVKVGGVVQTSGVSSQDFTNILEYVVVSENGQNSKTYKVKVQKQGDIIYLDPHAGGKNNGSTWKDAFRKLEDAIEAANRSEGLAEIWATKQEFFNVKVKLSKVIILRGGFLGTESTKDARLVEEYRTKLNNVSFVTKENAKIKGALVFDGIEFNLHLSISKIEWENGEDNSVKFKNCDVVDDSSLNICFGDVQRLEIENSNFGYGTKIKITSNEASSNNQMIIEGSNIFSKISCDVDKEHVLDILKVKNSSFSQSFIIASKLVEFENVNMKKLKVAIYDVEEKASFIGIECEALFFIARKKETLGDFSIKDSKISCIVFNDAGDRCAGSLELKDCKNIREIDFKNFNKVIIEDCEGKLGVPAKLNAKNIKIKNVKFEGSMKIYNAYVDKFANVNTEINNFITDELIIDTYNIKSIEKIEDSRFEELELGSKGEVFLKNLTINKKLYNQSTVYLDATINLENIKGNTDAVIEFRSRDIDANGISGFKNVKFSCEENINLNKLAVDEELKEVDLIGKNVKMKNTEMVNKYSHSEILVMAYENFDFDIDERFKYVKLRLFYPKAYDFNGRAFSNLELEYARVPFSSAGSITFTNCKFFGNFRNERYGTVIDSCEFVGNNEIESFLYSSDEEVVGLKIKNIEKRRGTLKIKHIGDNSSTEILNSHFEHTTFFGDCSIKFSSFKNIEKFSSYGSFDISNCKFEIDSAALETDIWFQSGRVNIRDTTFEKKYKYVELAKSRILLSAGELKLKNTKFIDTKSMCDVCIKTHHRFEIEDCTFVDSGRIIAERYPIFSVKNSIMHGVKLLLSVIPSDKVNYTTSSTTIFENCDFFNQDKPSLLKVVNRIEDNKEGTGTHDYKTAVKFEYDMSKIPSDLRSKISGSPTSQKIGQVLKPFITGSTERVGYFINLGNDEPSNSHPAKFLGNYY